MILRIENLFKYPKKEREKALAAEIYDIDDADVDLGQVSLAEMNPTAQQWEEILGRRLVGSSCCYYQLQTAGLLSDNFIHSKGSVASYYCIVSLTDNMVNDFGVSFWTHKYYGWNEYPSDKQLRMDGLENDDQFRFWLGLQGRFPKYWNMNEFYSLSFNCGLVFEANLFHSIFPRKAFGNSPEKGRLTKNFLFNV